MWTHLQFIATKHVKGMTWDLRADMRGDETQLLPGTGVFIEHNGRKCFAYLDADGHWRDYYNGDVLDGEVKYIPD
jgi:hypothetical protein